MIHTLKNQFRGINPHLHSFWQGMGKWNRFHNVHITMLMQSLKAQLIPMGYTADIEESLQLHRLLDTPLRPRSDLLIRDKRLDRPVVEVLHLDGIALDELTEEVDEIEHPFMGIQVSEIRGDGQVVAWLELLSPSNKVLGEERKVYRHKRQRLLESGLVFIELDYLHETLSTFPRLTFVESPFPYRIVVLDPRPELEQGRGFPYEFGVDEAIPTVKIPLSGDDVLVFDFDAVYQKTFEASFYGYDVDYQQLPMNFDTYYPPDQLKILHRMLTILRANDLENAPLPLLPDLPATLEDSLEQLAGLQFGGE